MTMKIQDVYTNEPSQDAKPVVTVSQPTTPHAPVVPDTKPVENGAPVAVDDQITTSAGAAISVDVVANDQDVDGDTLAVKAVGNASNGTTTIVDGKAVYTPKDGFSGTDSFVYTVVDGNGGQSNGKVEVTVEAAVDPHPVNNAPVAGDDAVTAMGGDVAVLNVLANDKDVDGDTLTVTNVGTPMQGTAKLNDDGTITYTANADAKGTDSYDYTISDGNGGTDTGTITATFEEAPVVDPHPANAAPVAKDDTGTTAQGEAVIIDVVGNDTDTDSDSLAVKSVGAASNGTTTIKDGKAVYTPNADFSGTDSFDYTVVDGNGGADNGKVSVTVKKGEVVDAEPTDPVDHPTTDPVDDGADQPTDEADKPVDDGEKPADEAPVVAESGGPGEDIFGTDGDDVLTGKEGDDGFLETKGNDKVDGGAGRNQIDYLGSSSEYTITRDGDTLTVVKPSGGTDTVTNVSGVYFFGDNVWKATAEFGAAPDDADDGDDNSDDGAGDDGSTDDHPADDGGDTTGDENGFGGKDFLGTDGDDVLTGGDGNDGFLGYAGNDTIDGGAGYNQVDYTGSSSDYSITRDGDTLTVVKPNGEGTDTVSNVSGVYFFGDDTWKASEEFGAETGGGDDDSTDDHPVDDGTGGGSDDGGELTGGDNGFGGKDFFGADGDDVLVGGDGNDGFLGYAGNDVIDGGAGYNQVDYTGYSADYTAGIADDGTIIVVKPNGEGTDALVNVDGIYFAGDDVWKATSDLGPISSGEEQPVDGGDDHPVDGGEDPVDDTPVVGCPYDDGGNGEESGEKGVAYGTDGFDILGEDGHSTVYGYGSADLIFAGSGDAVLDGGEGFDVMHANGASTDYTFEANGDGSVTSYSDVDGTDTMVDMEAVYFAGDDQFAMVSSLTGGGCEAEVEVEVESCH